MALLRSPVLLCLLDALSSTQLQMLSIVIRIDTRGGGQQKEKNK